MLKIGLQNDQLSTNNTYLLRDTSAMFQTRSNFDFLSPFIYFFHIISGLNCAKATPLRLLNLHMSHTVSVYTLL